MAKMFSCGRPILVFCKPFGATWRAVNETSVGRAFDYLDSESVEEYLSEILMAATGKISFPPRNEIMLSEYSFSTLTKKLVGLFERE